MSYKNIILDSSKIQCHKIQWRKYPRLQETKEIYNHKCVKARSDTG